MEHQRPTARERPILFSGSMVRAILEGRKTQTRRIVRPLPEGELSHSREWDTNGLFDEWVDEANRIYRSPYGVRGDRLWVRETHAITYKACPLCGGTGDHFNPIEGVYDDVCSHCKHEGFVEDDVIYRVDGGSLPDGNRWRPSIHMPRWASRINLLVGAVWVERLQSITEDDAHAEGVSPTPCSDMDFCPVDHHVAGFERLWDQINSKRATWASNPWVWVVEFARLENKVTNG